MSEDAELERLKLRKMQQIQRRLLELEKRQAANQKREPVPRETLQRVLVGRAWEVLDAAERQYPAPSRVLERELARLVSAGRLKGPVNAEQLLWLFRSLGLDVRLDTKIQVLESGELKPLAEKLRGE